MWLLFVDILDINYFASIDIDQSYDQCIKMVATLSKIMHYIQSKQIFKIYVRWCLDVVGVYDRVLFVSSYTSNDLGHGTY